VTKAGAKGEGARLGLQVKGASRSIVAECSKSGARLSDRRREREKKRRQGATRND